MRFGIGDMHHILSSKDTEVIELNPYVKLDHDIGEEMSAEFKYLIYNFHKGSFQVKRVIENRLFNYSSISNIDESLE
jgi:hypothetical protein